MAQCEPGTTTFLKNDLTKQRIVFRHNLKFTPNYCLRNSIRFESENRMVTLAEFRLTKKLNQNSNCNDCKWILESHDRNVTFEFVTSPTRSVNFEKLFEVFSDDVFTMTMTLQTQSLWGATYKCKIFQNKNPDIYFLFDYIFSSLSETSSDESSGIFDFSSHIDAISV